MAKRELALECNYTYEAAAQQRFRQLVASDPALTHVFYVPEVIPELSSRQVLTTEWVNGVTIDKVGLHAACSVHGVCACCCIRRCWHCTGGCYPVADLCCVSKCCAV